MKNQLPFCPYCKSRMSYLQAWGIHKDGEYRCPRCGKASNIRYTKRLGTFAAAACALGFLAALLLIIFRRSIGFGHVLLIVVPFLLFFLLTPFILVLSPMKGHRRKPLERAKPSGAFHGERSARRDGGFPKERPEGRNARGPRPAERRFYSEAPPGEADGDFLQTGGNSYGGYYSSKYDFSLFEETGRENREQKAKSNPSAARRRQAQKPAKRRTGRPEKPLGTEEEIDRILQDFIDE